MLNNTNQRRYIIQCLHNVKLKCVIHELIVFYQVFKDNFKFCPMLNKVHKNNLKNKA